MTVLGTCCIVLGLAFLFSGLVFLLPIPLKGAHQGAKAASKRMSADGG
jgi:hypothetical protein